MTERRLRVIVFHLAAGVLATGCGGACSLLVEGVTAKRIVWLAVGISVSLGLAVWWALREERD